MTISPLIVVEKQSMLLENSTGFEFRMGPSLSHSGVDMQIHLELFLVC